MTKNKQPVMQCPWCNTTEPPVPTDLTLANFQYGDPRDPKVVKANPLMCPECYGVGQRVDWEG